MSEIVKADIDKYDLIFMLYSFHHIADPLENKEIFLDNCYKNMKKDAYLLVLETFIPEEADSLSFDANISNLWNRRGIEGYASTYWAALQEFTDDGIAFAKRMAETSRSEEIEAGKHVYRREDEYLIKLSWLEKQAQKSGFQIVLSEPVNCIEEKAILLKK